MSESSPAQVLASLGSQKYPKPDMTLLSGAERAFKWTLGIDSALNPVWSCSLVIVNIEKEPFASGSCRSAHILKDLTYPNQQYVAKFSTKNANRDQYFMDVLMQTFCSKWSDLYNSFNPPKKITFLPSFVLELIDRGSETVVCGGEPFIEGDYKKFNNNSGYVNSEAGRNTPQAFSHFSLTHSNGELVIIDIQGVNDFYTDPQIHTKSGKGFGEGNLGANGIHQFVKTHQCNPMCSYLKLEPLNTSRRMLLRGTLPVVQLEFDKSSKTAVIKDGADEVNQAQNPLQPRAETTPAAPMENSWQAAHPPPDEHPFTRQAATAPAAAAAKPAASPAPAAAAAPAVPEQKKETETHWDLKAFKLLDTVRGSQAECIVADDEKKLLYTGSSDGSLGIWDPVELKHIGNFKNGHTKSVKALHLKDSNTLFSTGGDGIVKEWDITTQKVVNEAKDKGEINSIVLDNNMLYCASNDKTVKIWDTRSYKNIATLSSHTRAVKCLYVKGNYLFSGSNDQQILVWSLQTQSVLTNLQGHEGWIKCLVGNGSTLYSGSHDETIKVWDLNSLQCTNTMKAKDKVEALLVTPQALFSASGDWFEIWDTNDSYKLASATSARTSILTLARHQSRVFCGSIGNHLKVWSCE